MSLLNSYRSIFLLIILLGGPCKALASDIDRIAGKYEYTNYSFTLKNGEINDFGSLGATAATLEIHKNLSVTLTMKMVDGTERSQNAKLTKLVISGDKGHWLAKWPDVPGLVRNDFEIGDGFISYQILFSESNGAILEGVQEKGLLAKIKGP